MKKILHITASARGEESASYRLSLQAIAQLREQYPDAPVVLRDLCAEPLPHVDSLYSNTLARKKAAHATASPTSLNPTCAPSFRR
ncbi:MAG TPA: NAD(P)H-dependent oxidoreductase [Duganella sp.]|nr:NAD(P)H-dependent oxidoreductase [Duganella sp.]